MGPEWVYYLALLASAGLSLFSRTALVVTLAGAIVIAAWVLGAEASRELLWFYFAVHIAALLSCSLWVRSFPASFVAALFVALLIADGLEYTGAFTPAEAWRTRYVLVLIQFLGLPWVVEWSGARSAIAERRFPSWPRFERTAELCREAAT